MYKISEALHMSQSVTTRRKDLVSSLMHTNLLCGALFPVGGRGGCDVTDGGGGVRAVASSCCAGLRGDRGGRHVADQPRAALHPDVRVPLGGHVEDAEPVVVEAGQLTLEHACASLASTHAHRRLAVEDGQLATCMHTHIHKHTHPTRTKHAPGRKADGHTQNTATHTYIPVVTYTHTYTHKSV